METRDTAGSVAPRSKRSIVITSGLPDASREADERGEERRLRDLRSRVKAARAVVATTPGLAEVLASDWRKAARFYARFEITEDTFRRGVADSAGESHEEKIASAQVWVIQVCAADRGVEARKLTPPNRPVR